MTTSEELNSEVAGILARLTVKMRTDPAIARAMDRNDGGQQLVLDALEEAIVGLVLLHIQMRRLH